ncbi:hypothetical protein [Allokutzneria albata]|uniref:Uncharacterized protein n=1 Tax=Allokutzneria albata TaxID=211114 RepID=A0A1G9URW5_ALLAB|nr:hypothetical protein [Allokutzneria albata]SDM62691.1 hypothetical protein SAMN04489726_2582 [Allokutzneria albata]
MDLRPDDPGPLPVVVSAIGMLRSGAVEGTTDQLDALVEQGTDWVRAAAGMLAMADADMLCGLAESTQEAGLDSGFVEVLAADGEQVPIDDVAPPLRAALRTVLAHAYGDPESADEQMRLAFLDGDPATGKHILAHTVLWTAQLMDVCEERAVPVPSWLNSGGFG